MTQAIVLRGTISHYRVQRGAANFFFTQADQNALGMAAIGAAMVGASGVAMSTAISASDIEEEADHVQFTIEGKRVEGWLWRSPFSDGDEVEVVTEQESDHYVAVAIARPSDKIIAMYPHLVRGRWSHILNALKWWFWGMNISMVFIVMLAYTVWAFAVDDLSELFSAKRTQMVLISLLCLYAIMLLPTIHMTWKYMQFVRAAETVFKALGWKNVGFIDLNKSSNTDKTGNESAEYGTYYFRY